ncbi:hypothetical protein M9Y10_040415 [Tritrichomonas musculus]|uniref:Protein kinase domain-containing protein n=1 Tax=Tritrichomonas musculus TaxID=1915356 RepID=A0ABR2GPI4_9EUKA
MTKFKYPIFNNLIGYSKYYFSSDNKKEEEEESDPNLYLILEYAPNGSLGTYIGKNQIDNTTKQIILIGISKALQLIHQHRYIHLDIKPENVYLDELFYPHLSGFDFISQVQPGIQKMVAGTPMYMAPEVSRGNPYDYKVDIYSFSIFMYALITENKKIYDSSFFSNFVGRPTIQNFRIIINDGIRPTFDIPIKESIRDLIEQCWSGDPDVRPTSDELFNKLSHDPNYYLDDVDLEKINLYINTIQ